MPIISIGGKPGSGKSSIGKLLAQKLNITFFSMGAIRRAYAQEHNMTINELNEESVKDARSDILVDEYQKKLPLKHKEFIIDSRLGYFFIPQSVKVFVDVKRAVAAKRIFEQHRVTEQWKNVEEGEQELLKREQNDSKRYIALYNTDPNTANYDLVIDSTNMTIEESVEKILAFLKTHNQR